MTIQKILIGVAMVVVVALFGFGVWFMFFGSPSSQPGTTGQLTNQNSQSFSTSNTTSGGVGGGQTPTVNGTVSTSQPTAQKIFKIAVGPIEDATFIQTLNPTTTLARYIMQDSGHVLDIPLDVPGAVARVVSNTTIPGLGNALWFSRGQSVLVQYNESGIMKTLSLSFPSTNSATSTPKVRFLPDGIESVATSPDGKSLVYILPTQSGSNGYLANADGSSPVKLFSSALSQVLVSWPSSGTLLLQTKEASGVPGIAFEVSSTKGTMTPLVYATSLSAIANPQFSKLLYQTSPQGSVRITYAHDVKSGKDLPLPFNPLPEKCTWSAGPTLLYCAAPLASTPSNYLDLWHMGLYSAADSIFAFDIGAGITSVVAIPGSAQGGTQADIAAVRVSGDGKYLLFITKGDRSLWGVRLSQ